MIFPLDQQTRGTFSHLCDCRLRCDGFADYLCHRAVLALLQLPFEGNAHLLSRLAECSIVCMGNVMLLISTGVSRLLSVESGTIVALTVLSKSMAGRYVYRKLSFLPDKKDRVSTVEKNTVTPSCVVRRHPICSGRQTCGRTSQGHTGGRSQRTSSPSFWGASLFFHQEKDLTVPSPC